MLRDDFFAQDHHQFSTGFDLSCLPNRRWRRNVATVMAGCGFSRCFLHPFAFSCHQCLHTRNVVGRRRQSEQPGDILFTAVPKFV